MIYKYITYTQAQGAWILEFPVLDFFPTKICVRTLGVSEELTFGPHC